MTYTTRTQHQQPIAGRIACHSLSNMTADDYFEFVRSSLGVSDAWLDHYSEGFKLDRRQMLGSDSTARDAAACLISHWLAEPITAINLPPGATMVIERAQDDVLVSSHAFTREVRSGQKFIMKTASRARLSAPLGQVALVPNQEVRVINAESRVVIQAGTRMIELRDGDHAIIHANSPSEPLVMIALSWPDAERWANLVQSSNGHNTSYSIASRVASAVNGPFKAKGSKQLMAQSFRKAAYGSLLIDELALLRLVRIALPIEATDGAMRLEERLIATSALAHGYERIEAASCANAQCKAAFTIEASHVRDALTCGTCGDNLAGQAALRRAIRGTAAPNLAAARWLERQAPRRHKATELCDACGTQWPKQILFCPACNQLDAAERSRIHRTVPERVTIAYRRRQPIDSDIATWRLAA